MQQKRSGLVLLLVGQFYSLNDVNTEQPMNLITTFADRIYNQNKQFRNAMKVSMKFILAFLLLMLSYSISANAMDFSTCISISDCSCQISESSSEKNHQSSVDGHTVGFEKSQSLSISDVELGFKPVSETYNSNYRLRRIVEENNSLNDVMHKFFLLRENSLVQDRSKSYYSDKDPHYSIICSGYYVFALRHILI